MKRFKKFYFEDFEFDEKKLDAKFYYSFDKEEFFTEIINFDDINFSARKKIDMEVINNMLFHIHIVLGISYYKLYPTKELIVESGFLDNYQIKFWKNFYLNGLGEFLYKNRISPTNLFNFINIEKSIKFKKIDFKLKNNLLLAIGGGKDSIVSFNLLKDFKIDTYVFGKMDNIKKDTSKLMGKIPLFITRKLSDNLFILSKKGYYNGHVPITGLIAFVSELVCYLYDYKYIVLSNEKSASQENIIWKGVKINHQYSKSLEFEKDFDNYVGKYISSDIKYFSLLRGMYEFKIAELFSRYSKKYFEEFASCNNNFKIFTSPSIPLLGKDREVNNFKGLWCNKCPKCAFVFLILSNFLTIEELISIFGENLFKKEQLENIFRELIGLNNHKPFECVGTYEESFLSIYNAIKKYDFNIPLDLREVPGKGDGLIKNEIPFILQKLKKEVLEEFNKVNIKKLEDKLLKIYDEDLIPLEIKNKLKF